MYLKYNEIVVKIFLNPNGFIKKSRMFLYVVLLYSSKILNIYDTCASIKNEPKKIVYVKMFEDENIYKEFKEIHLIRQQFYLKLFNCAVLSLLFNRILY